MTAVIISAASKGSYDELATAAARALRDGGLVVFPTETVYGVAASAASPDGMQRLRRMKNRGEPRPFTVHIGRRGDAEQYVQHAPPVFYRLARRAWPGPVTLITETRVTPDELRRLAPAAQPGEILCDGCVGLRYPAHPVAERLLTEARVPVVASSANYAGDPPPTNFEACGAVLADVEYAFDGGRTAYGGPSTIVEVRRGGWSIQRAGVMEERTLRRLATSEIVMVCTGNSCRSPMAEYLFRHELGQRLGMSGEELTRQGFVVASAGAAANVGMPMSRGSLDELARRGINGSVHGSQPLTEEMVRRAERVFVMTPEHREAVLALAPGFEEKVMLLDPDGPVADPIGGTSEDYARAAQQIERAVQRRVEEYVNADRHW